MLQRALSEITTLREQNKIMSARLEVYENLMRVFYTIPNFGNSGLMHPDIAYEINKYLESQKSA